MLQGILMKKQQFSVENILATENDFYWVKKVVQYPFTLYGLKRWCKKSLPLKPIFFYSVEMEKNSGNIYGIYSGAKLSSLENSLKNA